MGGVPFLRQAFRQVACFFTRCAVEKSKRGFAIGVLG